MAVAVPSRFACLKIEDDDFRPKTNLNKPTVNKIKKNEVKNTVVKNKKNVTNTNNNNNNNNTNKPTKSTKPTVKTSKSNNENNTKPQSTGKNGNKKKKESDQWEKWKEKDMLLVDGTFEEDLQNAIMLSKLDYEEKKEFYQQNKKEESNEKSTEINGKKNKKKKAMTLEQFNCMVEDKDNSTDENNTVTASSIPKKSEMDDSFFDKIHREAKEVFQRERLKQTKKSREPYNGAVTIAQLQAELDLQSLELEVQRVENATLRKELEAARADIINVKTRNKKLCSLLGQGEMKDKAEVLLEVERLTRVQNELTAEVERLHGLLEQERSKVGALTHEPKHKEKNKKRLGNGDTKSQTK